jgi:hypothetical protein
MSSPRAVEFQRNSSGRILWPLTAGIAGSQINPHEPGCSSGTQPEVI